MKIYKHNSQILSIVYKDKDWIKGLNFITPNELYIQVGSWWYDKGKKLDSHIHKNLIRKTLKTQEMVYVKKGSMRVLLYDENQKFLEEFILYKGDTAIFANGGHGYEILDDDTQIIEAKNGPFIDVETDKRKF